MPIERSVSWYLLVKSRHAGLVSDPYLTQDFILPIGIPGTATVRTFPICPVLPEIMLLVAPLPVPRVQSYFDNAELLAHEGLS